MDNQDTQPPQLPTEPPQSGKKDISQLPVQKPTPLRTVIFWLIGLIIVICVVCGIIGRLAPDTEPTPTAVAVQVTHPAEVVTESDPPTPVGGAGRGNCNTPAHGDQGPLPANGYSKPTD